MTPRLDKQRQHFSRRFGPSTAEINAALDQYIAAHDRRVAAAAKTQATKPAKPKPANALTAEQVAAAKAETDRLLAERASLQEQFAKLESRRRGFAGRIRFGSGGFDAFGGKHRQRPLRDSAEVAALKSRVAELEHKRGQRERKGLASKIRFGQPFQVLKKNNRQGG